MATGATPERGDRQAVATADADHVAERGDLRMAGQGEVGFDLTRPAAVRLGAGVLGRCETSPEAVTPAAQTTVRAGMRGVAPSACSIVTPVSSTSTTVLSSTGVTPSLRSERSALPDNGPFGRDVLTE